MWRVGGWEFKPMTTRQSPCAGCGNILAKSSNTVHLMKVMSTAGCGGWRGRDTEEEQKRLSSGGSKGAPGTHPPLGPNSFILIQFSGKFWLNNTFVHPTFEVGVSPPRPGLGNPGSATAVHMIRYWKQSATRPRCRRHWNQRSYRRKKNQFNTMDTERLGGQIGGEKTGHRNGWDWIENHKMCKYGCLVVSASVYILKGNVELLFFPLVIRGDQRGGSQVNWKNTKIWISLPLFCQWTWFNFIQVCCNQMVFQKFRRISKVPSENIVWTYWWFKTSSRRHILKPVVKVVEEKFNFLCFS